MYIFMCAFFREDSESEVDSLEILHPEPEIKERHPNKTSAKPTFCFLS